MGNDKVVKFNKDLHYKAFGDLDEIIDEKGAMYIAIRKIGWYTSNQSEDEAKAKLDIRKWKVTDGSSDSDIPQRGLTFLTEEGPHNLVSAMVKHGYGKTKDVLLQLKQRDDFKEAVTHMYDEEPVSDEFFDARDMLLEA